MTLALHHIRDRAPPTAPPGQPLLTSFAEHASQSQSQATVSDPSQPQDGTEAGIKSLSPEELHKDIKELSYDLIMKEQQLEKLIRQLPGVGNSERDQVERMKELQRQLEEIEDERVAAVKEKEALVKQVEDRILGVHGL